MSFRTFIFAASGWALLTGVASAEARLLPGDTFELRLGGVPVELTQDVAMPYTIGDDGLVKLPYIGPVTAGGISCTQLARTLERMFTAAKIYSSPTVTITLPAQARLVTVGGAVKAPSAVAWTPDLTLTTAIVRAGGDDGFTKGAHTAVVRDGKTTFYDLRRLAREPAGNPRLLPGDEIRVQ